MSWENWIERYQNAGYEVIAPAWPGMEDGIDALRADPTAIQHLGIEEIVDHYDEVLLDRGRDAAGVAIDAAVKRITKLPFAQLKSAFPVLKNPANNHRAVALTQSEFHYAFTNTMSEEDTQAAFERYAVPGPGRVLFQGAFANFNPRAATRVDFRNEDRAPLLLIAGEDDHTVPAVVDRSAAKHYRKASAITEYKEFPGGGHFIIGQDG